LSVPDHGPDGLLTAFVAVLLVVLPLAIGFKLGRVVQRRWPEAAPRAIVVFGFVLLALALAATLAFRVGLYDAIAAGVWCLLGVLAGLARATMLKKATLSVVATAVALVAAEAIVRATLQRPYLFADASIRQLTLAPVNLHDLSEGADPGSLFQHHRARLDRCGYLYPELFGDILTPSTSVPAGSDAVILHLGDSMPTGGADPDEVFPAVLETLMSGARHINAAAQGTSVDSYFLVGLAWLDEIERRPDLVVVHLFPGNDVEGMDESLPCCEDQPILRYENGAATARCPEPRWPDGMGTSLAWFAAHSPPPLPLLAMASVSHLASHGVAAFIDMRMRSGGRRPSQETRLAHLRAALIGLRDEMQRRNIPLLVHIVALRPALEHGPDGGSTDQEKTDRLHALAIELGMDTIDSTEHFRELVAQRGADALFVPPRDVHLNSNGHTEMARWLREPIEVRLRQP
jgi:hypothetical protein